MALATEEMINSWIAFGEKAAGQESGFNRQVFRDFTASLQAFNDDPSNDDARPYFFIHRQVDTVHPISEQGLNEVLLKADELGQAHLFEKVRHDDGLIALYFAHAAVPVASKLCELYGYGYANLGANGICIPGFAFAGLTTASPERLKASVVDAKVYLVSTVEGV